MGAPTLLGLGCIAGQLLRIVEEHAATEGDWRPRCTVALGLPAAETGRLINSDEVLVIFGDAPLAGQKVERRFTHVWQKEAGACRLIARHANNVLSAR